MANSLMEFQNRMNQNRLFQSKFMANQALGEVIAHSGSLGEGLDAAEKNPLIMGFGADAFANARTAQGIQLQAAEAKQKLGTSGYEAALQAGIQAMNDPINYGKYFDNGMKLVDPVVQDRVRPQVEAVKEMIGQKIKGLDLTDPGQLKTAQDRIKAAIIGSYTGAGGDPSHLAPFLPSVQVGQDNVPTRMPSPQEIMQGGMPTVMQGGGAAPGAQPTGTVTNSSSGETYQISPDSSHYMETAPNGKPIIDTHGNMHLKPTLVDADRKLQDEHTGAGLEKYNGAKNMLSSLDQMNTANDDLTAHGGFTTPGFLGVARGQIANAMETIMHITGKQFTGDAANLPAENADIATINKWHNALTFQLKGMFEGSGARGLGVLMEAAGAVPGMENTPLAFKVLTAGLRGMADWEIGRYEFKDAWMGDKRSGGSLLGSDQAYNRQSSPLDVAKKELGAIGVMLDHSGKMVFKDNDALKNAYDTGLFGKPGSEPAIAAFRGMYKNMHPEEYK